MRYCSEKLPEVSFGAIQGLYTLRSLTADDIPQVMAIERASFRSPWSEELMRGELDNPVSRFLVAESKGLVLGYLCAWFVAGEVHLMNLVTHPEVRRKGVARSLLRGLINQARQEGADRIFLEVRESNRAARCLYENMGFRVTGRRRSYYRDTGEDALVMYLEVPSDGPLGG